MVESRANNGPKQPDPIADTDDFWDKIPFDSWAQSYYAAMGLNRSAKVLGGKIREVREVLSEIASEIAETLRSAREPISQGLDDVVSSWKPFFERRRD